eukprot:858051-Rhodomonas_salina.1
MDNSSDSSGRDDVAKAIRLSLGVGDGNVEGILSGRDEDHKVEEGILSRSDDDGDDDGRDPPADSRIIPPSDGIPPPDDSNDMDVIEAN